MHLFGQCRRAYSHVVRWSASLKRGTKALQWVLGQGTFTFGHVLRWVVVISQYLPMASQWRHWYWRFGHSFLRCWSRSRRNILTSFSSIMHWLVQQRRVYPHVVRWSSRDRSSSTQPHPFSVLLHMTLSALTSCSPTRDLVGSYILALIQLNPSHLWYQQSPVLFFDSLGKCWSASYVHPGRLCSRPSHSMSLGVDCELHEGRSDTPACLVGSPENCSHIHSSFEQLKPSVAARDNM